MCCLYIQFTHENNSERTILHLVQKKIFVWLLALQKRLATPLTLYNIISIQQGARDYRSIYIGPPIVVKNYLCFYSRKDFVKFTLRFMKACN
jgi:hypothetical protein